MSDEAAAARAAKHEESITRVRDALKAMPADPAAESEGSKHWLLYTKADGITFLADAHAAALQCARMRLGKFMPLQTAFGAESKGDFCDTVEVIGRGNGSARHRTFVVLPVFSEKHGELVASMIAFAEPPSVVRANFLDTERAEQAIREQVDRFTKEGPVDVAPLAQ